MKFENTDVWGFVHALRGMRNPKNSWDRSDSYIENGRVVIGNNDMKLAQTLVRAGSEHRKFMRQIFVAVDITAPLYWWKEFDTYKVGTVANSTSTMHKLTAQPITLECFETDDYLPTLVFERGTDDHGDTPWDYDLMVDDVIGTNETSFFFNETLIGFLESLRQIYVKTGDKRYWKELIRWLPESWLQKRTVTMNYENVFAIVHQRQNHKLNEWSGKDNPMLPNFVAWAKTLPYSNELLFGGNYED